MNAVNSGSNAADNSKAMVVYDTKQNNTNASTSTSNNDENEKKPPIAENKCDFDGFNITYSCDTTNNNNINATIKHNDGVIGTITVGNNNIFNSDYKKNENFIEMIFKSNKESVKNDIINIYQNNITKMKGVDKAFKEFYQKYKIFQNFSNKSKYLSPGQYSAYDKTTIEKPIDVLKNIGVAIDMNNTNSIFPEINGGAPKTRTRNPRRRKTTKRRRAL
jgi:hypothetical protein